MEGDELSFEELHAALGRCMEAHPQKGLERSLHPNANTLANLWGLMAYQGTPSVPVTDVEPGVLSVYERWSSASPTA